LGLGVHPGLVAGAEEVRFARGANNPPFAMRLRRMGHPVLWMGRPVLWMGHLDLMGYPDLWGQMTECPASSLLFGRWGLRRWSRRGWWRGDRVFGIGHGALGCGAFCSGW
jgi:hypothetical protein